MNIGLWILGQQKQQCLCRNQFLLNMVFGDKYIYLGTEGLFHEKHAQTDDKVLDRLPDE